MTHTLKFPRIDMQKQPPSCEKWLRVSQKRCFPRVVRLTIAVPSDHRGRRVGSPHRRRIVGAGAPTTDAVLALGVFPLPLLIGDGGEHRGVTSPTIPVSASADTGAEAEERTTSAAAISPRTTPGELGLIGVGESVANNVGSQHLMDHNLVLHIHLRGGTAPAEDCRQNQQNETDRRHDFHEQNSFPIYTSTFYTQCQA